MILKNNSNTKIVCYDDDDYDVMMNFLIQFESKYINLLMPVDGMVVATPILNTIFIIK